MRGVGSRSQVGGEGRERGAGGGSRERVKVAFFVVHSKHKDVWGCGGGGGGGGETHTCHFMTSCIYRLQ